MALDLSYDLVNDTPASASPVEANFNTIEAYVNQECITRDGSTAMTAQLLLVGDPVSPLNAATKQYVDAVLPLGIVMMYGGAAAPPGGKWAVCNGASLATVTYPDLHSIIGYTYGGAGGSFSVPNLSGRFPVGPSGGIPLGSTGGTADAVVVSHDHSINHDHASFNSSPETAAHNHNGVDHLHAFGGSGSTSAVGDHNHTASIFPILYGGFDALLDIHDGGASQGYALTNTPVGAAGAHSHTVSVSGTTGAADRSLVTGTENQNHAHTIDMPAFSGTSGSSGVSGTGANMPPYQGLTFIIRVL